MTKILISHGITPTGVGLRLRTNGALRSISPCCGRSMTHPFVKCKGCSKSYYELQQSVRGNLTSDITIHPGAETRGVVRDWVRKITGLPNLDIKFS